MASSSSSFPSHTVANGNGNLKEYNEKSSLDAVLDRMVATGTVSATTTPPSFIASSSWQGVREGYYFGTSDQGTGYYWDRTAHASTNDSPIKDDNISRKRPREAMEASKPLSAEELLQQAEQAVDPHSKVLDLTPKGMRHASTALEKATTRNALRRAQHADTPENYMESELALHEQISALSAAAANATNLFPTLLQEGIVSQMAQLLSHDNSDIALTVVHVLVEWLDVESYDPSSPMQDMARAIVSECLDWIVANLGRLDPEQEEDVTGMEDVLSLLETLMDMDTMSPLLLREEDGSVAASLVRNTSLVGWLLTQISSNKSSRAAEILSLVLQQPDVHTILPDITQVPPYTSMLVEKETTTAKDNNNDDDNDKTETLDGLEILLQAIALYRKTQPQTEAECEFLENSCLALASALTFSSTNVDQFLDAQGVELVLRCLKEKVHAGGVALKLLDLRTSQKACEYLVAQAGGLKYLFPLWVGRSLPRPAPSSISGRRTSSSKARKEWVRQVETQVIHILYNLTRFLTEASPQDAKERLLVKFLEDDCEKCDRLIELCLFYDEKARLAEYKFYRSDVEEEIRDSAEVELAALNAKLKGGGDLFHRLGAIAAFVCVGSKKGHRHILEQLSLKQSGIGVIKEAIKEFASILDDGDQKNQLENYLSQL